MNTKQRSTSLRHAASREAAAHFPTAYLLPGGKGELADFRPDFRQRRRRPFDGLFWRHNPCAIHCRHTSIGSRPLPDGRLASAFPITVPKAFMGSSAFMAWPGVAEVVRRSPTSTGPYWASTLQ